MKHTRQAFAYLRNVLLFIITLAPAATLEANSREGATLPPTLAIAALQSTYGKLPLSFEANHGQWDPAVQFVTRGRGHTLFLTPSEAVLTLRAGEVKDQGRMSDFTQRRPLSTSPVFSQSVVRMKFSGAEPQAEMVGLDKLPGIVNYFIGDDPSKWRTNIPTYQKVEYKNLYDGIDLVYYGNQGHLEYDLVVAPGADPSQIMLAFDGAEQLTVDEQGDLILTLAQPSTETGQGETATVRLHKPIVYQQDEQGEKHLLASAYVLRTPSAASSSHPTVAVHPRETQQIAFEVASYDASLPLIIDPVLSWATYLGGSNEDRGQGIAVDQAGNAYITGFTQSTNFPGTAGHPQSTFGGDDDAFVTKLDAAGTAILYSTYLGGNRTDQGMGIAVDAAGNAYVTGHTDSANFPGTAGSSVQSTLGGDVNGDAFVTKLNAAGTAIVYSTYLGGRLGDEGNAIAVDAAGNAYVTGGTVSDNFPGAAGSSIQTFGGFLGDVFVTKLNAAGTAIVYSTYLGGRSSDVGKGIAVDAAGNAYVTGATDSENFPGTAGSPIQSTPDSLSNAFVTKLNEAGTAIVYSTYLGGGGHDAGFGIAVDAAGNAYVTGNTTSDNFSGTAGSVIQSTFGGGFDAFVTKLNEAGTAILYSTYLGGNGEDQGMGIAVDQAGQAYVTGDTKSSNFPGTAGSPIQSTFGGGVFGDAFVTKLNAAGTALIYSTYLGSSGDDIGNKIAVDLAGAAHVTGFTTSSDFPGTAGSRIQSTNGGGNDAFVAKISSSISFAAFDARAKIDVDDRRHHGGDASYHRPHRDDAEGRYDPRQDNDKFDLTATFTLGGGSNGIDPLKEAVMIQVGTFSTAIPPGSFKQHKGRFVFEGTINGVHIEAVLRSLILGNDYQLKVEGHGADLTGTKNPVTVSVTIGDDSGSKAITAKIK